MFAYGSRHCELQLIYIENFIAIYPLHIDLNLNKTCLFQLEKLHNIFTLSKNCQISHFIRKTSPLTRMGVFYFNICCELSVLDFLHKFVLHRRVEICGGKQILRGHLA